ncbi:MAG: MarR family transcriptional regulator [Chloroflexi bacterium]|nr:MAG: MarR family transcriptional regulator [Chloroflexota bacterium]
MITFGQNEQDWQAAWGAACFYISQVFNLTVILITVIFQTMTDAPLTSWICTALMRIGTRMATGFDQHFAELGITQAQFRILLAVWEQGGAQGIAPSVLASHLLIERGTISILTNRMVERGWLVRNPGENRRTYRLTLSPTGRQLLDKVIPLAVELADQTLSGIPLKRLHQMRENLEVIEAGLRGYSPLEK